MTKGNGHDRKRMRANLNGDAIVGGIDEWKGYPYQSEAMKPYLVVVIFTNDPKFLFQVHTRRRVFQCHSRVRSDSSVGVPRVATRLAKAPYRQIPKLLPDAESIEKTQLDGRARGGGIEAGFMDTGKQVRPCVHRIRAFAQATCIFNPLRLFYPASSSPAYY